jgi:hypothetical protein
MEDDMYYAMHDSFQEEISERKCVYRDVCLDRGCPCKLDGHELDSEIYERMRKEYVQEIDAL